MQNDLLDQWGKLTRTTFEALKEFGEISTKVFEKLAQTQLDAVNTSLEASVKGTQVVSQSKDYNDYIARQAAVAAEYNEKFLEIARKANKIVTDGREELTAWVERQVDNSTTNGNGAKTTSTRKAA
jgi:phasin family protein